VAVLDDDVVVDPVNVMGMIAGVDVDVGKGDDLLTYWRSLMRNLLQKVGEVLGGFGREWVEIVFGIGMGIGVWVYVTLMTRWFGV
jgi:hypothetical protein